MSASPADEVRVATLMSVYASDQPANFLTAVDSVLEQKFEANVESRIYLGIDGPLPPSLEAAVVARSAKIHLISRSTVNLGLAATLNRLIGVLDDEVFVFRMDADDISLPDRYMAQIQYFRQHPEIDILGTDIVEFDVARGERRVVAFARGPEQAVKNLHRRVPVAHPTVCFRRRVLETVRGYPMTGTNEDVSLWFICAQQGFRFDNVPALLLEFRITEDFWRRRGIRKAWSEWTCYARGIAMLHSRANWRQIFPALRFGLRIAPKWLAMYAYRSRLRSIDRSVAPRSQRRPWMLLGMVLALGLLATTPAWAYLDPNSGGWLYQLLFPLLVAVGAAWAGLRARISAWWSRLRHRKEAAPDPEDSSDV